MKPKMHTITNRTPSTRMTTKAANRTQIRTINAKRLLEP